MQDWHRHKLDGRQHYRIAKQQHRSDDSPQWSSPVNHTDDSNHQYNSPDRNNPQQSQVPERCIARTHPAFKRNGIKPSERSRHPVHLEKCGEAAKERGQLLSLTNTDQTDQRIQQEGSQQRCTVRNQQMPRFLQQIFTVIFPSESGRQHQNRTQHQRVRTRRNIQNGAPLPHQKPDQRQRRNRPRLSLFVERL